MGCHVHVPQTAAVVLAVAERIRSDIEATARGAVRDADVMPITQPRHVIRERRYLAGTASQVY